MAEATHKETAPRSAAQTAAELLAVVADISHQLHPRQPQEGAVTLDSSLERGLGLDSLARVELVARVERHFDLSLSDRVFAEVETPRDLLRALLAAGGRRAPAALRETAPVEPKEAGAVPYHAETLVEVLGWHRARHPDRPLVHLLSAEEAGATLTYSELYDGSAAVAGSLQALGLRPGDPVALMLPTGRDYLLAFFGILLAGAVPVPIYPPARSALIEDHLLRQRAILANCRTTTLITTAEAYKVARLIKAQLERLQHVVTVAELATWETAFTAPAIGPHEVALLQYTSGSTGHPKGVVLTHANLLANVRAMGDALQADATDVVVCWLPLYHDMGLIGSCLGTLYYACRLVLMSPLAFLARPERWLWAIHHHQGTISGGPNFAYELCVRRIEEREIDGLDLGSWRFAFNGAEPVNPGTVERFYDRFRRYGLRREALAAVYGLAEATVGLTFPSLGRGPVIDRIERDRFMRDGRAVSAAASDANPLRFVACGQPLYGCQIAVVDPTGRELPERQEGEILFRGDSATSGYYRNREESEALFRGEWLTSGDRGYLAAGDLYVTGRSKELIIRAGRNISPYELEEAIGNLTEIRQGRVAVFGSSDSASGTEQLVVLAETRADDSQVRRDLREQVNAAVTALVGAPPDQVVLAPPSTILKTSSGKIRRAASRELYEGGHVGQPTRAVWWQVARLGLGAIVPTARRARRVVTAGLFAAYAWGAAGLLAAPLWLAVALLPRPDWRLRAVRSGLHLLAWATRTPLVVRGLAALPPPGHPCVVVANHASYLDSLVLVAALPHELHFVAKVELRRGIFLQVLLRRLGTEFVERFDAQRGVLDARRLATAARAGGTLAFFPEGTFTRVPGLRAFHMGAFVAAGEAGVPVVPVAIRGTRSILLSDTWFPRHGAITVSVGPPIVADECSAEAGSDPWTVALHLRDTARAFILHRCGEPDLGGELHSI